MTDCRRIDSRHKTLRLHRDSWFLGVAGRGGGGQGTWPNYCNSRFPALTSEDKLQEGGLSTLDLRPSSALLISGGVRTNTNFPHDYYMTTTWVHDPTVEQPIFALPPLDAGQNSFAHRATTPTARNEYWHPGEPLKLGLPSHIIRSGMARKCECFCQTCCLDADGYRLRHCAPQNKYES